MNKKKIDEDVQNLALRSFVAALSVFDAVEKKIGDLNNSKDGEILKQAILICMNDTEVEKLEIFLNNNS